MTIRDHIRNPIEWGVDQLKSANLAVGRAGHSLRRPVETRYSPLPAVRRIELADLRDVLARGLSELRGVPDRRQAMSRSLDQPILVSASFAAACGEQRERLVSIGRYALRGVGRPQELFTPRPRGTSPATPTEKSTPCSRCLRNVAT